MATKNDLKALIKGKEDAFDIFMTQFDPILIGNTLHYQDEAVKIFLEIHKL